MPVFGRVAAKIAHSIFLNFGVTGPKYTKFLHDVDASSTCSLLKAA